MQNGTHKSLEEVMHFYNTRDLKPDCAGFADPMPGVNCWPAPEIGENPNTEEFGDPGLSAEEEAAIVTFLPPRDDGWMPAVE